MLRRYFLQGNKKNTHANANLLTINHYADNKVWQDVLALHHKGNIHVDKLFQGAINFPPLPYSTLLTLQGYDTEISPFHAHTLECQSLKKISVRQQHSAISFSSERLDFTIVQTLLNEAFASDDHLRRPYASASALYSIEVLCVLAQDRINGINHDGIYHYRPNLKKLQLLKEASYEVIKKHIITVEINEAQHANVILIYFINLPKAVVQYRYRGYRLALMEVGAMLQQADLVGQELNLQNKLSTIFNDLEIGKFVEIDRNTFLPAMLQFFGR